jgi:GTP-binding nuclear protein Ran
LFVQAPALRPAEVSIDPNLIRQYEAEMAQAAQLTLPDEDVN